MSESPSNQGPDNEIESIVNSEWKTYVVLDKDVDDKNHFARDPQVDTWVRLQNGLDREYYFPAGDATNTTEEFGPPCRSSSPASIYTYHTTQTSPIQRHTDITDADELPHISIAQVGEEPDTPQGENREQRDLKTEPRPGGCQSPPISIAQSNEGLLLSYQQPAYPAKIPASRRTSYSPLLKFSSKPLRLQALRHTGAIFDTLDGRSCQGPERWFHDLRMKTHALLAPLQTGAFKRVRIAVLDTGIDMDQINLWDRDRVNFVNGDNPRIKKRKDFLDPDRTNKCRDHDGHGTHCVGVIRTVAPEADVYVARVAVNRHQGPDCQAVIEVRDPTWKASSMHTEPPPSPLPPLAKQKRG